MSLLLIRGFTSISICCLINAAVCVSNAIIILSSICIGAVSCASSCEFAESIMISAVSSIVVSLLNDSPLINERQ